MQWFTQYQDIIVIQLSYLSITKIQKELYRFFTFLNFGKNIWPCEVGVHSPELVISGVSVANLVVIQ